MIVPSETTFYLASLLFADRDYEVHRGENTSSRYSASVIAYHILSRRLDIGRLVYIQLLRSFSRFPMRQAGLSLGHSYGAEWESSRRRRV